jgi:glycosyltransferase involved in cell wall biosynthesis
VTAHSHAGLDVAFGSILAADLVRAADEVDALEREVIEQRQAQAEIDASRLGRYAAAVRQMRSSPLGFVRASRRLLRAAGAPARVGTALTPRRPELRFRDSPSAGPLAEVDPQSLPTGLLRGAKGVVLLSRRQGALHAAYACTPGASRTVPLGHPISVTTLSADGSAVLISFTMSVQAAGSAFIRVDWLDADGVQIGSARCGARSRSHRLVVPEGAKSLQLSLRVKGSGVALVNELRLSLAGSSGAVPLPAARADEPIAVSRSAQPVRLSLVAPLYNVEPYIGDLLSSIEQQEPGPYELDVVLVDDGSTDRTPSIVREWIARMAEVNPAVAVRLMQQENAGPSAAKNAGLDVAGGDYVSFPDGDDVLETSYLRDVSEFIVSTGAQVPMVDMPIAWWAEGQPLTTATAMMPAKYAAGSRVVELSDEPGYIKTHSHSAFFRRDQLVAADLRFPTGIHSSEDMLFCAGFLASLGQPQLAVVDGARYLYRRRSEGEQLSNAVWSKPEWIVEKMRHGYLPLIERASDDGELPRWLCSFLLYDYRWMLEKLGGPGVMDWPLSTRREILELVRAGLAYIPHDAIDAYAVGPMPEGVRRKLHILKDRDWTPPAEAD